LLQKQVAGNSGFAPSYIAALEGGRRPPPPADALKKIVTAIGASEQEEELLIRASKLTDIARVMANYSDDFPGAAAAMSLLEISSEMTAVEVDDCYAGKCKI
jgi:transcriptional regulator with XRE-family HTH domain